MISTVVSQNCTIAITKFVISQKITKISTDHKKLNAKLKYHKMKREPSFVYSKTEKELSEIKKELRQERMGRHVTFGLYNLTKILVELHT